MSKQIGNLNVQMETIFKKEPNGHSRTKKYTTEMKKKKKSLYGLNSWFKMASKIQWIKGLINRNYTILRTDILKNIDISKQFLGHREHY